MSRRSRAKTGLLLALGVCSVATYAQSAAAYQVGIGVFRPSNDQFILRQELTPGNPDVYTFAFGAPGDIPLIGDWDGDGTTTAGVYRPPGTTYNHGASGLWILSVRYAGETEDHVFNYGAAGDIPVVGDWDGNGSTTIGVYRRAGSTWLLRNSNSAGTNDIPAFAYGAPDDTPVVGDWDGNGTTTIGVYRPAGASFGGPNPEWLLRNSNSAGTNDVPTFAYGAPDDKPVVGDWDGNGTMTIGVYRPSTQQWIFRNDNSAGTNDIPVFAYGAPNDLPVVGQRWLPAMRGVPELRVPVVQQIDNAWCWAATANMIMQYFSATVYGDPPAPSQCQIANRLEAAEGGWGSPPSQIDCCANPAACNHGGSAGTALCQWGYQSTWGGPMSYDGLASQMKAGSPVAFSVLWNGGSATHLMVVSAVYTNFWYSGKNVSQWVNVLDPGAGDTELIPYAVWSNADPNKYSFTLQGQYSNISYVGVGKCTNN